MNRIVHNDINDFERSQQAQQAVASQTRLKELFTGRNYRAGVQLGTTERRKKTSRKSWILNLPACQPLDSVMIQIRVPWPPMESPGSPEQRDVAVTIVR